MKIKIILMFFMLSLLNIKVFAVKIYTPQDGVKLGIQPDTGREERLKRHEEEKRKILEERRKAREEELAKQREEAAKAAQAKAAAQNPSQPPQAQKQAPAQPQSTTFQTSGSAESTSKNNSVLYLLPLDIEKKVGEAFVTWIELSNESNAQFDEIKIFLSFDPNYVKPIKIFDSSISNKLNAPPIFKIDNQTGEINYEAKLKNPDSLKNIPILKIIWATVKITNYTEIDFLFQKNKRTGLYLKGKNLLGNPNLNTDGTIPASIIISDEKTEVLRKREGEYYQGFTEDVSYVNTSGKVSIELTSAKKVFSPGEEVVVDVVLKNPDSVFFDSLKLWVKFDPAKLEAIDWDNNNWIKTGLNSYDGFARKQYPFDFHKRNYINNDSGEIDYRMGLSSMITLPSGTFLKIKFKAKDTASLKDIYVNRAGKREVPNTSFTFLGKEMLDTKIFKEKKKIGELSDREIY